MIIDWLAVEMVCNGTPLRLRYAAEKRAVIRRLDDKLVTADEFDNYTPPGKVTATDVARWLHTTERSVWRMRHNLPPAVKGRCPRCGEQVWVHLDGTIEAHPNPVWDTCGEEP